MVDSGYLKGRPFFLSFMRLSSSSASGPFLRNSCLPCSMYRACVIWSRDPAIRRGPDVRDNKGGRRK